MPVSNAVRVDRAKVRGGGREERLRFVEGEVSLPPLALG
jgi:hypothetical protein